MNLLLDTNVVLDDILNRSPKAHDARKISQLAAQKQVNCFITANSITDIYYVVSKKRGEDAARKVIRNLLINYEVLSISGEDCLDALDLHIGDFEDALVVVCAQKSELTYIVTNDQTFLGEANLSIPLLSPADFLKDLIDS